MKEETKVYSRPLLDVLRDIAKANLKDGVVRETPERALSDVDGKLKKSTKSYPPHLSLGKVNSLAARYGIKQKFLQFEFLGPHINELDGRIGACVEMPVDSLDLSDEDIQVIQKFVADWAETAGVFKRLGLREGEIPDVELVNRFDLADYYEPEEVQE